MFHFLLPYPITNHGAATSQDGPGRYKLTFSHRHSCANIQQNKETENRIISFNIYLQAPVFDLWKTSAQTHASAHRVESGTGLHRMSWGAALNTPC